MILQGVRSVLEVRDELGILVPALPQRLRRAVLDEFLELREKVVAPSSAPIILDAKGEGFLELIKNEHWGHEAVALIPKAAPARWKYAQSASSSRISGASTLLAVHASRRAE